MKARERISHIKASLVIHSPWLSRKLDAEVYLKLECFQPGNSFKIRGASNALLSQDPLPDQVITASGGNHGLGVAFACRRAGVPCKVVLPTSTSEYRAKLLREIGAEVQLYGDAWDDANSYALELANSPSKLYIHPFADYEVVLGQGTIALELMEQLPEFDILVASVGGGGLLTGISLALEQLGYPGEIVAVETIGAESMHRSLAAAEIVELDAITSIAKTLGARKTEPFIFESLKRLVTHSLIVDDKNAVISLLEFLDNEKILIEPATSCTIAAAFQNPEIFKNKKVVFIICGSNVSMEEVENWKEEFKLN